MQKIERALMEVQERTLKQYTSYKIIFKGIYKDYKKEYQKPKTQNQLRRYAIDYICKYDLLKWVKEIIYY